MERAKLKLTVILLLAVLNVFLLGLVLEQNAQARSYEAEGRTQATAYLARRGVTLEEDCVPWDSAFQNAKTDPRGLLFDSEKIPADSTVASWEILPARQPETLLVDCARVIREKQISCTEITAIREGYDADVLDGRVVLTPVWEITTDAGQLYLNCTTGEE